MNKKLKEFFSKKKLVYVGKRILSFLKKAFKKHWLGALIITAATLFFFWSFLPRLATYNAGGDAMFNAWTLARNHHCLLMQGCPDYADGNIFFSNENSMLYSETQLSAGLLTLPLHFINDSPIFSYNVWTILSMFFSGLFMYLLAMRLSKGNKLFSIASGLVFQFAPYKAVSLIHLQNLSIFWLPLIILFIVCYAQKPKRRYLVGLLISCVLLFYASWYQMVFALAGIAVVLLGIGIFKIAKWRKVGLMAATVFVAIIATLPLAIQYINFSKQDEAKYGLLEQTTYSSSVADYFIPPTSTLEGKWVQQNIDIGYKIERFNADSSSYHGLILYVVGFAVILLGIIFRKRDEIWKYIHRWSIVAGGVILAGLIISLGPLLKVFDKISYPLVNGGHTVDLTIPLPYIIVDILLPQLSFIRAIGRSTVLVLFGLCIILALLPLLLPKVRNKVLRIGIVVVILAAIFVELMPYRPLGITNNPFYKNATIPAAYTYIKDSPEVDNIVILAADYDYPGSKGEPPHKIPRYTAHEQVLWAGYHNKNIFNGFSGYFPERYNVTLEDFIDFKPDDIPKMEQVGLEYILVDKLLSKLDPELDQKVAEATATKVYEDERFSLYKISE